MLCHQPTPYGMDMIPIAKVQNLSYNTQSAGFILVKFKNSPQNHQSSEQHKAAQYGDRIENFGNFSLKILGIFVPSILNTPYNRCEFQAAESFLIALYFSRL